MEKKQLSCYNYEIKHVLKNLAPVSFLYLLSAAILRRII